jgi:hypothetical protein
MPRIEIGEPERRRLPRRFSFHWGLCHIDSRPSPKGKKISMKEYKVPYFMVFDLVKLSQRGIEEPYGK